MSIIRCPHCDSPVTESESASGMCLVCGKSLIAQSVCQPAAGTRRWKYLAVGIATLLMVLGAGTCYFTLAEPTPMPVVAQNGGEHVDDAGDAVSPIGEKTNLIAKRVETGGLKGKIARSSFEKAIPPQRMEPESARVVAAPPEAKQDDAASKKHRPIKESFVARDDVKKDAAAPIGDPAQPGAGKPPVAAPNQLPIVLPPKIVPEKAAKPAPKEIRANYRAVIHGGSGTVNIVQSGKNLATASDGKAAFGTGNDTLQLFGPANFEVEIKELTRLTSHGTGNVKAKNIAGKRLEVIVNGSGNVEITGSADDFVAATHNRGDLTITGLNCKKATIGVNGSGNVHLQGTIEELTVVTNNVGGLTVEGLKCKKARIEVHGSKDVSIKGNVEDLSVIATNVGGFTIDGLDSKKVKVEMFSSGKVRMAGVTDELQVSTSNVGDFLGVGLKCKRAKAVLHGSGGVRVNVSDTLEANAYNTGRVEYLGSPKITGDAVGRGLVRPYVARPEKK